MSRDSIIDRMDAALEKMRARGMKPRAFYLTPEDRNAVDQIASEQSGSKTFIFGYCDAFFVSADAAFRDVGIRPGNRSILYSKQGVSVNVPKRLSARVAA